MQYSLLAAVSLYLDGIVRLATPRNLNLSQTPNLTGNNNNSFGAKPADSC